MNTPSPVRARLWPAGARRPPLVLLVPSLLVTALMLLPLLYLPLRAQDASGGMLAYLTRPRTLQILWNTLLLVTSVSVASLVIALPVAWLTLRTDLPGRRVWLVLAALPLVIPSYVGSFAYISAFATGGLLAWLPVRLPAQGFWGAFTVLTLFNYPYLLLALRAGMQGLDPSLEEASRSLGHTRWGVFWRVTLPLLRPAIAAGTVLVALYVLSDFGAVAMLRYDTFTRAIFVQYQNSFNRANAALLALVLVALMVLILAADQLVRGSKRVARVGSGVRRKAATVPLGRWKLPALLLMTLLVGTALVAPLSVVGVWFWRGVAGGQALTFSWPSVWNTVGVSAASALLSVVAALPIAVLAVRYPSPWSALVERLSYVGFALPGVVVGLAFVFFGVRYVPALYQTHAMLLTAYLVLFLPQAVANVRASLVQLSPNLEEAARSLGRSPWRTLVEVTLPLIRAGLLSGATLVFLTTMKELPVTLILHPTGFETLATNVWQKTFGAFFAQAAPYALAIVAVSAVSGGLLLWREGRS
ncbi:ABC transporter permease [Truepera radiovictrix]|uniref:Binding-protein-dependent transport systems inner membrane component n=1 Tax=Truepera radiovictrix (strain DSM 17093 / CIP 108686 / LMG 22925 / RQ-24) TaxID=649638 RepID=D7CXQ3_TRURR|nr:iron ABC transporter permease [Truepera radiovictrix]ADI14655.1 binding-protein-dependent transport systems inner membrane component [Truepera radiovictrix DSM 17093]WMT56795.1 iron ABC transporter permease [Truepera radiovictrix]